MSKEKDAKFMIHVKVVEGKGLRVADIASGSSDPYVTLKTKNSKEKYKSNVKKNTLNPVWDEEFTFSVKKLSHPLVIKVKDRDLWSDDFLGKVSVDLTPLEKEPSISGWFQLKDKKLENNVSGEIFLEVVRDRDLRATAKKDKAAFVSHRRSLIYEAVEKKIHAHKTSKLKIFVGTWNVGNKPPQDDLSEWIPAKGDFDIVAIGAQECEYQPRKEYSNCAQDWQMTLSKTLGADYVLIAYEKLLQIRLTVFATKAAAALISHTATHREATGIANVVGNKGGVAVGVYIKDTSVCFVNSHLAAHQHKTKRRNTDVSEIIKGVRLDNSGVDILHQFNHVIWMGDLNYRLDYGSDKFEYEEKSPPKELFEEIVKTVEARNYEQLFATDQLAKEMKEGNVFRGFQEGRYDFAPTFKVHREKGLKYEDERSPAWCDRVLWRTLPIPGHQLRQLRLTSAPGVASSDHKPVAALFDVDVVELPPAVIESVGKCTITITGLKGKDLPVADVNGSSDPYVIFTSDLLIKPISTGVVPRNTNPEWKDDQIPTLELSVNRRSRMRHSFLVAQVYDKDIARDDLIATGLIPLAAFVAGDDENVRNASFPFVVELTDGGLPAGKLEGTLKLHWDKSEFKSQVLQESKTEQ